MRNVCGKAALCLFVLGLLLSGSLYGQQLATLNVTVVDQSGGVIPNAKVSVRNLATEATRSESTSDSGTAVIPALPAGNYELTITSGQFTPYKENVTLAVGQIASPRVTLGISVTEKVEVHASTQGIDTEKAEVSQVIERQEILDLPISGRDFIDFVLLTPTANVGRSTAVGAQSPFTETVLEISFAGLRETHSTFFGLDGTDYTTSISGVQRTSPSQDWVQEFRVVDSPYTADNGRNLGSIVETITKSGSNAFHGSAYEFFRNNALDANNALSAPGFNTLRSNQFGAYAGGPVIKDKSFFFAGYEGQRRAESPVYSSFILHCIDTAGCLGPGSPSINQVKQSLGLSAENLGSILQIDNYDRFLLKSSNALTDKTNLNVAYLYTDDRKQNAPGAAPGEGLPSAFRDNPVLDQTIYSNIDHVFNNTMTSETVIDYGRRTFNLNPVGAGFEPALNIPDLLSSGGFVGSVHFYREQNFQVAENLTKVHGNHTFKFGGDIEPTWISVQATLFSPGFAVFSPPSFFGVGPFAPPDFGPGTPQVFLFLEPREFFGEQIPQRTLPFQTGLYAGPSEAAFNAGTSLSFEHTLFSLYGQDQWRARPNLTLTFGLRYDVDAMPSGRSLKLQGAGNSTNYGNVQPRVGFSYAMRGGKTVVRGGAGIFTGPFDFSDVLVSWIGASEFTYMNQPILRDFSNPSKFLIGTGASGAVGVPGPVLSAPAFRNFTENGIYPAPDAPLLQFPLGYATRKFQNAYAEQGSLEIENEIAKDTFVSIGYQWVHALRLPVYSSINGVPDGTTPGGVQAFTPADHNFGFSLIVAPVGYSNYNGGTLSFRKNFSNHYSVLANYTYSKSIDISTDVQLAATPYDYLNPGLDRARGDNDVRHRFTLIGLVETPHTWNLAFRDFKFSMINTLQSPRYYTILAGFDVNGDIYPFSDRVGTIGRNTYRGDSLYDTDIRIQRDIPITERFKGELSFEVFNLFNRPNVEDIDHVYGNDVFLGPVPQSFGDGVTSPANPTFGSPKFVAPARQIQLSLRVNF
ncbi:MAG: TonB-dependent receptor domain-containing protein [Candidatus Acidiferrales bacterium]